MEIKIWRCRGRGRRMVRGIEKRMERQKTETREFNME